MANKPYNLVIRHFSFYLSKHIFYIQYLKKCKNVISRVASSQ